MTVCNRCAKIDLDDAAVRYGYLLGHVRLMVKSAKAGCPGCKFMLDVCRRQGVDIRSERNNYVMLRRLGKRSHLVRIWFVELEEEGEDEGGGAGDGEVESEHGENKDSGVEDDEGSEDGQDATDEGDEGKDHGPRLIRLCSAYGMERHLSHDVEHENDHLPLRLISAHSSDEECFDLARSWFERCTRSHGPACALNKETPLPTRLIHIPSNHEEPLRLCRTEGQTGQYVALSYVWGAGSTFKTTRKTLSSRMSGFPSSDLPKSVRDAVEITRRIGFQYLWVDALCIIQSDFEDWSHESALMAVVYGGAAFTISADLAEDTDQGILRERDLLRSHCFGGNEQWCFQEVEAPWKDLQLQYVYWRGWCFQERVLSVRVLHYFEDHIAWECNTTVYREGFHGRESHLEGHFGKWIFTKQIHQKLSEVQDAELWQPPLQSQTGAWNMMVQELAIREFTQPSDRLPGISGIAAAMQLPKMGSYLAGVWSWNPFLSMQWHCRKSQQPPSDYRSPSWSWVWTTDQLVWPYSTWANNVSADVEEDWKAWDTKWAPRLLEHDIVLKGNHPKGEVAKGSSITVSGHCRWMVFTEQPGVNYDMWGFSCDPGWVDLGTKVHLDWRPNNWASEARFEREGEVVVGDEERGVRVLPVVQILRERKPRYDNAKVLALILEEVVDGTYKRAGVVDLDLDESEEDKWERRTLKLV
ncbi:HET-domain-containing protein [Lentithecium fluviatile CBS 122367]|uniref:HET-domain-containing protein n=1 Tax=Lentithecium fluviatile CBS 122367 TaxID=1168545 RepID=A0A6G1JHD0_9PLEO|nr:HET-domain-containing protein [Lentithecium fluviatile CBS 122367]